MLFVAVLFSFVLLSEQCCYPPEWETDETVITGTKEQGKVIPVISKSHMKLSWDGPLQRFFYQGSSNTNGTIVALKGLADYISNVMYAVVGDRCNVTKITESFDSKRCTPANAKQSEQFALGLGQLQLTQYNYQENNMTYFVNVADGCVPVSVVAYGITDNARVYTTASFENLTVGIKDRSIFNIPHECRGSTLNTIG